MEYSAEEIKYRHKIVYISLVMALLIIVRHSLGFDSYNSLTGLLFYFEIFLSYATDLVVPTFFALSGFLFYQNFQLSNLFSKWRTRFWSLFVPFIVWNILGFAYV